MCDAKYGYHIFGVRKVSVYGVPQLRDKLVHDRRDEDETPLATYDTACSEGFHATFALMNLLSEGIFDRPLRPKLHDLMDFHDGR